MMIMIIKIQKINNLGNQKDYNHDSHLYIIMIAILKFNRMNLKRNIRISQKILLMKVLKALALKKIKMNLNLREDLTKINKNQI